MERHSVPQNIMDVEFKLFGAFTIKQFAYLAGGFIGALLIYFLEIPGILKFLFIPISVTLGLFTGLLRINGQPSTVFLSNFVSALFNSQVRVWKKTPKVPEALEQSKAVLNADDAERISIAIKEGIRKQKSAVEFKPVEVRSDLDKSEEERLEQIEKHFNFALKDLQDQTKRVVEQKPKSQKPYQTFGNTTKVENPIMFNIDSKNDNLAGSIASKELQGKVLLKTNKYANIYRQMQSEINRPLGKTTDSNTSIESKKIQEAKNNSKQDKLPPLLEQNNEENFEKLNKTSQNVKTEKIPSENQNEIKSNKESQKSSKEEVFIPQNRKPNIIAGVVMSKNEKPISEALIEVKTENESLVRKLTSTLHLCQMENII